MSQIVEGLPSVLSKVIKKTSGYRKINQRLQMDSSSTAGPNDIIRLNLPTSGILDTLGLMIHADFTSTHDGTSVQAPDLEGLVMNYSLKCGSENVVSINQYNDVYHILCNATESTAHRRMKSAASNDNFGIRPRLETITGTDSGNNPNETTAFFTGNLTSINANIGVSGNVPGYAFRDGYSNLVNGIAYPGVMTTFFGLQDFGYVDSNLIPQLQVELVLGGSNVLSRTGGTTATYTLSNLFATIPIITLPAYSAGLFNLLTPDANGASQEYYYKFTRYIPVSSAGASTTADTLKFSIASSSLNRIWLTYKASGYATQGARTPGNPIPYFTYTDTATGQIRFLQLYVDDKQIPAYRIAYDKYGYSEVLRNLRVINNLQYDNLIDSCSATNALSQYNRTKYFHCWSLCFEGDPDCVSGYNTMGASSQIRIDWETNGTQMAANGLFTCIADTSAYFVVGAGRQIRVEY
jgi:uncharacterized protein YceK